MIIFNIFFVLVVAAAVIIVVALLVADFVMVFDPHLLTMMFIITIVRAIS